MGRAHADAAQARTEADAERAAAAAGRAETAALRGQVEQGGAELRALRGAVRAELSRLHALLGAQLKGFSEPPVAPEPASVEPAPGGEQDPAWTPTPGTADLFDTPPRPVPPVPAQRSDTGENRHSLRSG
ncbi:hypothetical protein, partial [Pseudonocardia pini]|uniref:hypothetical protein n=1 Tax=Pseudonocardia pini TaxID=2758030 RepID=UPI001C692AEB